MREYLKAIGFSDLNSRKKIDELINEIKKNPSRKKLVSNRRRRSNIYLRKRFCRSSRNCSDRSYG